LSKLISGYDGLSRNARGAFWMIASAITFTVMTLLIKYLGSSYPPALQAFYRQLAGFAVMLPLIWPNPRAAFRTTRLGILLFRAAAGTVGMILGFYAYQAMPLADANALSFTRTLWLVPLAVVVLRERIGIRRIAATTIGFAGAILMLQPSTQTGLGWPATAALSSAFLFALTVTGMKVMTRDHSTLTLMSWSATLGLLLVIPPAVFVWRWPSAGDFLLLSAMGVLGTITQACYIKGMSLGDAAAMAPLDYTRLVFAVIFGFLMFEELPSPMTMLGAVVIIVSTVYIVLRETRLGKPRPPASREE
jgi:drug/metabolite transporter (DMT)-like permease